MIEWIQTSRLSRKNYLSASTRVSEAQLQPPSRCVVEREAQRLTTLYVWVPETQHHLHMRGPTRGSETQDHLHMRESTHT